MTHDPPSRLERVLRAGLFAVTAELNPPQFFTLYSGQFQAGNAAPFGTEEEVTPFRCQTRNVRT